MRMVSPHDPGPGLTHNKNIVAPKMTTALDIPSQGKPCLSSSAAAPPHYVGFRQQNPEL